MSERESVTIDPDGTITIDDPEIEAALQELARRWNVPIERAFVIALEQALAREGASLD